MTRKVYRTAQGKTVDLGALQLQNENVRAVGNMGVNARGDLVDGWNRPIDTKTQQVARQYNKQTTSNVSDGPVPSVAAQDRAASAALKKAKSALKKSVPTPPENFDDDFEKSSSDPKTEMQPTQGLAAAIARARQIRQELIQSPDQIAQNKPGVTRI